MSTADKAAIERNVRQWRRDKAKRAVRVEIRQQAAIGEEPSLNETAVELEVVHREAQQFGASLQLP